MLNKIKTTPLAPMNRHRFLGIAAAVASWLLIFGSVERNVMAAEIGSTDHFWYRLAPEGPYIDSQRENKAFGFGDGKICLSEDNGQTWPHSTVFPNADNITFSCIMKNGNIIFATRTKLYLSTDNLKTYRQIIVTDTAGNEYRPHTPLNPDRPDWYFHPLDGVHTWDVNGSEMLVWGNYSNVLGGAVPNNIYYSTDQGETAYGQESQPNGTDNEKRAVVVLLSMNLDPNRSRDSCKRNSQYTVIRCVFSSTEFFDPTESQRSVRRFIVGFPC